MFMSMSEDALTAKEKVSVLVMEDAIDMRHVFFRPRIPNKICLQRPGHKCGENQRRKRSSGGAGSEEVLKRARTPLKDNDD